MDEKRVAGDRFGLTSVYPRVNDKPPERATNPAEEAVPVWKFWHPLPVWQALAIFIGAQLIGGLLISSAASVLGSAIPPSNIGGALGFIGFAATFALARRARAKRGHVGE